MSKPKLHTAARTIIHSVRRRTPLRKSVVMGTTADRENLTEVGGGSIEKKVAWGSYGPKVATNVATGALQC